MWNWEGHHPKPTQLLKPYSLLENHAMKYAILLATVVTFVLSSTGCQETHRADSDSRSFAQAQKDFEKELKDKIAMTEQHLATYRTNGYVIFKVEPSGASIYINDGDIGTVPSHILIPSGTYHIKAVWPDGRFIEKKLFVLPALQAPTAYDWKFEHSDRGVKSSINYNAPLHKTEVVLVKPKE